jgi:hypothetical protein
MIRQSMGGRVRDLGGSGVFLQDLDARVWRGAARRSIVAAASGAAEV